MQAPELLLTRGSHNDCLIAFTFLFFLFLSFHVGPYVAVHQCSCLLCLEAHLGADALQRKKDGDTLHPSAGQQA